MSKLPHCPRYHKTYGLCHWLYRRYFRISGDLWFPRRWTFKPSCELWLYVVLS